MGIGEDGPSGLCAASRDALDAATHVIGAPRQLALLPAIAAMQEAWPVPFADGIERLLARRGTPTVMLASGDPFWFGAGSTITARLDRGEWVALPARSTFALAAAQLGWRIEDIACLGLHAAPLTRLRPLLAPEQRAIVLLRDGAAACELARYLAAQGFGESVIHVLEALGGARERVRITTADGWRLDDVAHPVALGIALAGAGRVLSGASGRADDWFAHDGQLTKRPQRALALSALAPRAGELLWDVGTGSGSIAIEWLLSHSRNRAIAVERDPVRAARARANAAALGVDRLMLVEGAAPAALTGLAAPDAVFVGGGLSRALLDRLVALRRGTRLVAHAVTLESEVLLAECHAARGGTLLRIELAEAAALGARRGWRAHYPIVQWSATL